MPFADVGPLKMPDGICATSRCCSSPTSSRPATWPRRTATSSRGDTVAVWGCGPVGQFAIRSAFLLGAERVIAIDDGARAAAHGRETSGAETINFDDGGRVRPAQGDDRRPRPGRVHRRRRPGSARRRRSTPTYDKVKAAAFLATDRPSALRQAIHCCRKGGTVSIPGVYGGFLDKIPFGAAFHKGLTFKMGQTHVHRYMQPLLDRIERGEIDPSFVITHRLPLDEAPQAYKMFRDKQDECIKVVLKPHGETVH